VSGMVRERDYPGHIASLEDRYILQQLIIMAQSTYYNEIAQAAYVLSARLVRLIKATRSRVHGGNLANYGYKVLG
jgi:hypothetical protein